MIYTVSWIYSASKGCKLFRVKATLVVPSQCSRFMMCALITEENDLRQLQEITLAVPSSQCTRVVSYPAPVLLSGVSLCMLWRVCT